VQSILAPRSFPSRQVTLDLLLLRFPRAFTYTSSAPCALLINPLPFDKGKRSRTSLKLFTGRQIDKSTMIIDARAIKRVRARLYAYASPRHLGFAFRPNNEIIKIIISLLYYSRHGRLSEIYCLRYR